MDRELLRAEFVAELKDGFTFDQLAPASNRWVRWRCSRNPVHVWDTKFQARRGCPFCANMRLSSDGSNSFAALHPDLATEWSSRNALKAIEMVGASGRLVWWRCVGGHEWEASPNTRVSMSTGCPYCSGKRVSDKNSIAFVAPILLMEWDDERPASEVACGSHYRATWKCSVGHRWRAMVQDRALKGRGCPYCAGQLVAPDTSLLATLPALATEWHSSKNSVGPGDVTSGTGQKVWWACRTCGKEWQATVKDRARKNSGCPSCACAFPALEREAEKLLGVAKFDCYPLGSRAALPYRPDFQLSERVFLNVDGLYWHSEACRPRRYHFEMREAFERQGLRLLQFYEDEVVGRPAVVRSVVDAILGRLRGKIYARACVVEKVSNKVAQGFLDQNHLIGPVPASRHLGLWFEGRLVYLMSIRLAGRTMEITRSCPEVGALVPGGFSRLLAAAKREWSPVEVVTHVDLRYADGHSLEKVGFIREAVALDYQFTRSRERKDKRCFRVPAGRDGVGEAAAQGWVRIFNAGRARYRLRIQGNL